jgi:hypothetical protein
VEQKATKPNSRSSGPSGPPDPAEWAGPRTHEPGYPKTFGLKASDTMETVSYNVVFLALLAMGFVVVSVSMNKFFKRTDRPVFDVIAYLAVLIATAFVGIGIYTVMVHFIR